MNDCLIKISIVIPVKNGEKTIVKCLDAIQSQTLFSQSEVIIIDSGSTDGTLEILAKYPFIRLYQIAPDEFNHGGTRNYGVSLAKGEFVVMTVQDAWAASDDWLEIMYNHFKDEEVVAVVGQQVAPHLKGINPHQWYRPVSQPRLIEIYFKDPIDYLKLSGKEQDDSIFYDDVNTMYRKTVLLEIPFENIEFGEDMLWMKTAISKGHKAIYDARSSVWHYHFLDKEYLYHVTLLVIYFKYLIFGYIQSYRYGFKEIILLMIRNFKYQAQLKWLIHNYLILKAQKNAYSDFNIYWNKGEKELTKFMQKIDPKIVQGKID